MALLDRFDVEGRSVLCRGARHGLAPGRFRSREVRQLGGPGTAGSQRSFRTRRRSWLSCIARGLRVTLNVHPHEGVQRLRGRLRRHVPRRWVWTPPVTCGSRLMSPIHDLPRRTFDVLHHPLEDQGVDFWWIDWQQGARVQGQRTSTRCGCSTTCTSWIQRRGGRRGLTFSRYAGPGSHRYPVGFSGDAIITWDSLRFQPQFTATASNIGYGWWSHDIGGPPARRTRRRTGGPLGPARRVLAYQPPAFLLQPVPAEGTMGVPAREPGGDRRAPCGSDTGWCPTCTP